MEWTLVTITNSPAGPSWAADDNERYGRRPPPTSKSWTAGYWPWWTYALPRRRRAALLAADWRRHQARNSPGTPIKHRYSSFPRKRCTHSHTSCTHKHIHGWPVALLFFSGSLCASLLCYPTFSAICLLFLNSSAIASQSSLPFVGIPF